jgi:hypothetical protein
MKTALQVVVINRFPCLRAGRRFVDDQSAGAGSPLDRHATERSFEEAAHKPLKPLRDEIVRVVRGVRLEF